MSARVKTDGKHLSLEGRPFRVKGVTYGSFTPRLDGELFPESSEIKKDLLQIEAAGLNTVRTYTLPPPEMLDLAGELGLRLIVGLHYEDWRYEGSSGRRASRRILDGGRRAVDEAMERCRERPEVLAMSVGNEVPADVARVHGIGAIEETLSKLVARVHDSDPHMLATYCNFPTTEYLHVEGQDLACHNVFLEDPVAFRAYLRHLQVECGDMPLLITELGLSAGVHSEEAQAESLSWQLRTSDECGVAGVTVFSWTDAWAVAGKAVEGWGFGITSAERAAKPALDVVSAWARSSLRELRATWPRISIVVCAYNAAEHIEACLTSLEASDYPELEVIVCDDGSSDGTPEIARGFPFKVLELAHRGLSSARNEGISAATGEIVAFLDADAFCHPEWPYHLALSLEDEGVAASGGPNLPVPGASMVERAVSEAPGGPVHVLLTDDRAEHVPGCNMAFRKDALLQVEGFDSVFTSAGDDVDVCWKILEAGHDIAFSPAAQVRHRRRDSVSGYLAQQKNYGKAERLVATRHRHRFNRLGQARWAGFIYGGPRVLAGMLRPIVYHGYQGTAPYQGIIYRRSEVARVWASALVPLAVPFSLLGLLLMPLSSWAALLPAVSVLLLAAYATSVATGARPEKDEPHPLLYRLLVAYLHIAQPLARAWGRLTGRPRRESRRHEPCWAGDRLAWLKELEKNLASRGCSVKAGAPHDGFDLQVSLGMLVVGRITTAVTWSWNPLSRVSLRLSRFGQVAVLLMAALLLAAGSAWVALAAALVPVALLEAILLRRLVTSSIQTTTKGAAP